MAKLVFGMNVSLDGYVDHEAFAPDPALFRHWIDVVRQTAGSIYGRTLYEIMRYWDDDHAEWDADAHAFSAAWRAQAKWVVSRSLTSVGPNATLITGDPGAAIARLKKDIDGEIDVGGPNLAAQFSGLIDEYRLYLHPVVLGQGRPFFVGARPPLRLTSSETIGARAIRLTYVPA